MLSLNVGEMTSSPNIRRILGMLLITSSMEKEIRRNSLITTSPKKSKSSSKKMKTKSTKQVKYSSTKPIKSKAPTQFRNKSNI